jgi:hypothetical protein
MREMVGPSVTEPSLVAVSSRSIRLPASRTALDKTGARVR